jgi:hypothetical protein
MAWRWRRDHDIVRQRYVLDQSSSRGGLKPSQLCPLRTSISKNMLRKVEKPIMAQRHRSGAGRADKR